MITRNVDPYDIVASIRDVTQDHKLSSYLYIACSSKQQLDAMKVFSQAFADNGFFINSLYSHRLEAECIASGAIIHIYATHLAGFDDVMLRSVAITDVFIDVDDKELLQAMVNQWTKIVPCIRDFDNSSLGKRINNISHALESGAEEMIDTVHTNEERIAKIRSVFTAIEYMAENHPRDPAALNALILAAKEADGSLKALELALIGAD